MTELSTEQAFAALEGVQRHTTDPRIIEPLRLALVRLRKLEAQPEPHGPTDKEFDLLNEANNILCAANHALKTIDGVLETTIDEEDGYTFCDLVGDVYSIRRALVLLDGCIKAGGLKGDPVQ